MERPARRRVPRRLRTPYAPALVLALVAGGFAAWAGQDWYDAAHDDRAAYAVQRDRALAAGEQAVQNLNTLDHRDLGRGSISGRPRRRASCTSNSPRDAMTSRIR